MMFRRMLRALRGEHAHGHVCPTASLRLLLRALAEHVGRQQAQGARDSECAIAIMEAHDELRAKVEAYEAIIRRRLSERLGTQLPADAEITPEVAEAALCAWRDPGRVLG
jgi:hypothetical protein